MARLMSATSASNTSGFPPSHSPPMEKPSQMAAKTANRDWYPIPAARRLPSLCEKLM